MKCRTGRGSAAAALALLLHVPAEGAEGLRGALDPVVRGGAQTATARGDRVLEELVEKLTGRRSAVWVSATALQSLGGDGCKRVRLTIRAPEAIGADAFPSPAR